VLAASDLKWGTVPEWVVAVVALLALIGSTLLVITDRRRLHFEREARRDEEHQRRLGDARKVTASFTKVDWPDGPRQTPPLHRWNLRVENTSTELTFYEATARWDVAQLRSTGHPQFNWDYLRPGRHAIATIDSAANEYAEWPFDLIFRDEGGWWWCRDESGRVERLAGDPGIYEHPDEPFVKRSPARRPTWLRRTFPAAYTSDGK
jgi:hypothetical protein